MCIALGRIFSMLFHHCISSAACLALILTISSLLINLVVQQHNVFLYCVRRLTITYTMRVMSICVQLMHLRHLVELIILLLFRKLRTRNFCQLFLRYLINSYFYQKMMVRWNGSLSSKFDVTNSVKQGEVLSSLLFFVYLNDLLC